jgi:hypothetical protein
MSGVITRLFRVVRALLGAHLESAQRELQRDAARVGLGVALLAVALVLGGVTFLFVDAGAVLLLHDLAGLEWWLAFVLVGGVNAACTLVLALAGRAKLRGPVLVETRAMTKSTVAVLRAG